MIHEPHYWTDPAASDKEEERIADQLGVPLSLAAKIRAYKDEALAESIDWEVSQILSKVLSELIRPGGRNIRARLYGLIFATGLDEVNNIKSQNQIAREIKCTRALISHYTTDWADKIRLGVFKFRKCEDSRQTFQKSAIRTTLDRKIWSWAKGNSL
jgi:hypothetical protein